MPYKVFGNCVHKLNADGSKGELVKCHDDPEKAKRHMRALYANVHEAVAEFSMAIVKANVKDGVMRWRSVNSDIGEDYYGERMSKELFSDFIQHINNNDPIPEPFKSVIAEPDWDGGMPYISIAHYKSGAGRVNVPGEPQKVFLDGEALKSTGIMYDTPLGRAVFKSMQKDLVEKRDDKMRISIGFLDLEHSHGDKFTFTRKSLTDKCPLCKEGVGDKIYKKGHLVHLALTRVPANPRTDVEVERAMTTKREDAESIVEDEEVIKTLDLRSVTEDVLVVKAEEDCDDDKMDDKKKKKTDKEMKEESVNTPVQENSVFSGGTVNVDGAGNYTVTIPASAPVYETPTVTPEPSAVEKSFAALVERIASIKAQGLKGDEALTQIQEQYSALGEVIKSELTPPPSPEEVAVKSMESTLRSLLAEMLPQALAQTVAPIQSKLEQVESELRAKSLVQPPTRKEEIVQRSIQPSVVQKQLIERAAQKTVSQFDQIARQSVGLQ